MANEDTRAVLDAINRLALQMDRVAGIAAGIAACVAYLPKTGKLGERDRKAILVAAQQLAPQRTGKSGVPPSDHAHDMAQKIIEIGQSLEAHRSAGQSLNDRFEL